MVRCFIATYPLEEKIVNRALLMQNELKKFVVGKFVERENFHITLSFLGEKTDQELEKIKNNLKDLTISLKKRLIFFTKLKLIPSENFVKVLVIEVLGLDDISKRIEDLVGGDVKPPHLTLLRVKNVIDRNSLIKFSRLQKFDETMEVKDLKLMKSVLRRSGPIYEVMESFPLSE